MIPVTHLVFISTTIIKFLPSIESLESNRTVSIRYLHLPSGSIFGKRSELDSYSKEQDDEQVEDQNVSRENLFIESPEPLNGLKEFEQERNIKRVDYPISGSIFGKRSEEEGYTEPNDDTPLRINNQRTEEYDNSNLKRTIYPYSGSIYGKRSFKRNTHYPISGSPFGKRTSYYPISGSPFGKRTRTYYPISGSLFGKRNPEYYPVSGNPFGKKSDTPYLSERCNDVFQKRNTYPISGSIFGKRTDSFYPYLKKKNYFPINGSPFGKRTRVEPQFNFKDNSLDKNYGYIYDDREIDKAHLQSEPSSHLLKDLDVTLIN